MMLVIHSLLVFLGAFTFSSPPEKHHSPFREVNPASDNICDTYANFWAGVLNGLPDAAAIAPCEADYNCHGFVRSYFQHNCQPNPYSYYSAYTCPDGVYNGFQNYNRYIEICNESNCDAVQYNTGLPGGHSAVKVNNYFYISKWGADGPLVRHKLDQVWQGYQTSNKDYYAYIGDIQGSTSTLTGNRTFSIGSNPELTYTWYTYNAELLISGSATQSSVTVSANGNGSVTLYCTIASPCSSSITKSVSFSVSNGTNSCTHINGTYSASGSTNNTLHTLNNVSSGAVSVSVSCTSTNSFTWVKTSGNVGYWYSYNNGKNLSFYLYNNNSVSFKVTAAGSGIQRTVTFYASGGWLKAEETTAQISPRGEGTSFQQDHSAFKPNQNQKVRLYPNPSNGAIRLNIPDYLAEQPYQIIRLDGKLIRRGQLSPGNINMNLTDQSPGIYTFFTPFEQIRFIIQ